VLPEKEARSRNWVVPGIEGSFPKA
jgi:hypothetical protein